MILVLGGYGTFGSRIAAGLCQMGHKVIINGRNQSKAEAMARTIRENQENANITTAVFDVETGLSEALKQHQPKVVIHTCGPFQGQNLSVAKTLINAGVHGIDLSDSRDYVAEVIGLDAQAKAREVALVTAASTVPALSSAVLSDWEKRFGLESFKQVRIGISPGQRTDRGEATVKAVLSYLGKPMLPPYGEQVETHGWQGLHWQKYPNIGRRMMGACEAPDLDLLGRRFPITKLQFSAGMESKMLHMSMWLVSWLVRLKLPLNLANHSKRLMKMARWFDVFGTGDGGMHVLAEAVNQKGQSLHLQWFLEAMDQHGPQIPAVPAILLADRMIKGEVGPGVRPCVEVIELADYLNALSGRPVTTREMIDQ